MLKKNVEKKILEIRTQGMWRFEWSQEEKYITAACELSVTRLPHERYRLIGGTKF